MHQKEIEKKSQESCFPKKNGSELTFEHFEMSMELSHVVN